MKERFRDIRGMSLLEVMISLVILAVGLLGLSGLQITAMEGNRFAGDMTQATNLALNTAEELRGLSFDPTPCTGSPDDSLLCMDTGSGWTDNNNDKIPDQQGAFFEDAKDHPFSVVNVGAWEYNLGWNVFDIDISGNGTIDTKSICIIVTWVDMLGLNRRVIFNTMVTRSNPFNFDD
ncbi:MAG: prepilin-type N-terminal cleavage/methylation domain-containing protein [Deltaproteobacteria bacterium]|nr:MAG: prepilin-type N-terminal cleavage/methylation domain-containing protein [Deltaproteobacteria bacterium]